MSSKRGLKWWLRIVGVLYLFTFVAAVFLRLPIRVEGPEGVLARAASGDATANFLVETWVRFGLEMGAIGAALLIASRVPDRAKALVWTVIGIEVTRGILSDIWAIALGHPPMVAVVWMVIHSAVILTGVLSLRRARSGKEAAVVAQVPSFVSNAHSG
jgi:hypothetical protein